MLIDFAIAQKGNFLNKSKQSTRELTNCQIGLQELNRIGHWWCMLTPSGIFWY